MKTLLSSKANKASDKFLVEENLILELFTNAPLPFSVQNKSSLIGSYITAASGSKLL